MCSSIPTHSGATLWPHSSPLPAGALPPSNGTPYHAVQDVCRDRPLLMGDLTSGSAGPSPALLAVRASEQLSLHPGSGASNPAMHGLCCRHSTFGCSRSQKPLTRGQAVKQTLSFRSHAAENCGGAQSGKDSLAIRPGALPDATLASVSPRRPALAASLEQKTQVYGSHVTVSSTLGPRGASRPESLQGAGDWHSSAQTATLTTKSTGRWPYRTRPRVSVLGTEGMRRADFLLPPKLNQRPPSLQSPGPVS